MPALCGSQPITGYSHNMYININSETTPFIGHRSVKSELHFQIKHGNLEK